MTPNEDIYERLADALAALPHGFARTASGVEIELMKKAFTSEEAWLASHLTRTPETAAEIAKRVGRDVGDVTATLESLLPRGLVALPGSTAGGGILKEEMKGEKQYRLRPFMVGWYEASMRRLDKEFAELFEKFIIEGGGERVFAPRPGLLGVVPQRGTLKPEWIAREPHLDIDAHFERHERFLVIPCVCKREVEVLGHAGCRTPMQRCGFVGLPPQTPLGETVLDREQAKALFAKLEKQGHVHLAFYGFTMFADAPQFMGTCNCCSCCCGVMHGPKLASLDVSHQGPQKSNYRAVINPEPCTACGTCILRCPVDAITEGPKRLPSGPLCAATELLPGKSVVDRDTCIGCAACVTGCPEDAIVMEPVSEDEWFRVPTSMAEWEEMRLKHLEEQPASGVRTGERIQ
ncbi:MAG: 4Fe-4S binding protein [Acidobacteria bacterium]|nr:4Fe-4S binding protein [Acidobacteriota bacterium]